MLLHAMRAYSLRVLELVTVEAEMSAHRIFEDLSDRELFKAAAHIFKLT